MTRHLARLAGVAAIAVLATVTTAPKVAHADTSSTLTVVGTSDVFDSDLIQKVIKPDFEAAYPQYTLHYVSLGTGAAISYAEAGTASALLVHAASLENQFVDPGAGLPSFSDEQYGRAIFYGDYVLLGPADDPAHVLSGTSPSHNIAAAFQKIAAAGAAGEANFVSRGGTPGTTVEEHSIWSLTTGVNTCTVMPTNGGGSVPQDPADACTTPTLPAWYHATGLTQGPNVVNADTCNYSGGNCYVLTDRGTYQYLRDNKLLSNLEVVDNNNTATAPGGQNLLINSFHAYALNPAAFAGQSNVHLNLPAATAFLNWLTSPAGQADVSAYQSKDSGGASFHGDAAPSLTASAKPATVRAGKAVTISGTLVNKVPGTPPLAGVSMTLSTVKSGKTTKVASTTTTSKGAYSFRYKPKATASYVVSSSPIAQVELSSKDLGGGPAFGDLLQATSKTLGTVKVTGKATITGLAAAKGRVTITGTVAPAVHGTGATLRIMGVRGGGKVKDLATRNLADGTAHFSKIVSVRRHHRWTFRVTYANPGRMVAGTSAARSLRVT